MTRKRKYRLPAWSFSTGAILGACALLGLIGFALYDSVSSAKQSEERVRNTTLAAELSNFLLATREPDGSSLLENPTDFSMSERPLTVVSVRRSFPVYILNRSNARTLTAESVVWEPQRPCILEFAASGPSAPSGRPFRVQACFAVVPAESLSRYVYFSIRYPTRTLRRHQPGESLMEADRVVITFGSERPISIDLVYQQPPLAVSRYPSQLTRFEGIHEVSAFLASNADRPIRQVVAQAFERLEEFNGTENVVTMVGRIDSSLLPGAFATAAEWPSPALKKLAIGMKIYSSRKGASPSFHEIQAGELGRALVSLQNAYLASVPSRSKLIVSQRRNTGDTVIWNSTDLNLPEPARKEDWRQKLSDWWAPKLLLIARYRPEPGTVEQPYRLPGRDGQLIATLASPPILLPDFATRAFGWLTLALVLTFLLGVLASYAIFRLRSLIRLAWAMTFDRIDAIDRQRYGRGRDEFSTLWRVLNSLYARTQANRRRFLTRLRNEEAERANQVRLMNARVELRQERLTVIGHELRSPLASLLARHGSDPFLVDRLTRMQNAVEAILESETVEDGLQGVKVVRRPYDLSKYLSRLVQNLNRSPGDLLYVGPEAGIVCSVDDFLLDTVIGHLLDNARRYRVPGSAIRIELIDLPQERVAHLRVANDGPVIPPERHREIFFYKNTDRSASANKGIGLYAARVYLFKMDATIHVEVHEAGVAFVVVFPLLSGQHEPRDEKQFLAQVK